VDDTLAEGGVRRSQGRGCSLVPPLGRSWATRGNFATVELVIEKVFPRAEFARGEEQSAQKVFPVRRNLEFVEAEEKENLGADCPQKYRKREAVPRTETNSAHHTLRAGKEKG